jgi:hypothetical protein
MGYARDDPEVLVRLAGLLKSPSPMTMTSPLVSSSVSLLTCSKLDAASFPITDLRPMGPIERP